MGSPLEKAGEVIDSVMADWYERPGKGVPMATGHYPRTLIR